MKLVVHKTEELDGEIIIPGSKSHTIRAVLLASLADGTSTLNNPLASEDTLAMVEACKALGATIDVSKAGQWKITGFAGNPKNPEAPINLKNSGTSLRLISGVLGALCDFEVTLEGDESLQQRPMQPLLTALNQLGADALSVKNNGCCPLVIKGIFKGGETEISGITSQYVSSLLLAAPLAKGDTVIKVINPHEIPYIKMTLQWMEEQGIRVEVNEDFTKFTVEGNQAYKPFAKDIPADWSSATFPLIGAAITSSNVLLQGLDVTDVQGDTKVMDYLKKMGADVSEENGGVRVKGKSLMGASLDLNATPDALPALSVLGCFASGTTTLLNVAQARIKETDRIKVMAEELSKLGADIKEGDDGLVVHQSKLTGNKVRGHGDHRVVMALSLAGMMADGKTEITTAEAMSVTFPSYVALMKTLGAKFEVL